MSEGPHDAAEPRMSTRAKGIGAAVIVLVLLGVGYLLLRLSTPTIPPDQTPPSGHFNTSCGICHSVDPSAPRIRVR